MQQISSNSSELPAAATSGAAAWCLVTKSAKKMHLEVFSLLDAEENTTAPPDFQLWYLERSQVDGSISVCAIPGVFGDLPQYLSCIPIVVGRSNHGST